MDLVCNNDCKELIRLGLEKSTNYNQYMEMMDDLVLNQSCTGMETEANINFTMLNQRRMKRWNKTLKINSNDISEIKNFDQKVTWLVLTESWCGDAAHLLPVMDKVSELTDNITFRTILRDENPELMQNFLTDGTMSIPKLIMINDDTGEVINTYGSRPQILTDMVKEYKQLHGNVSLEFKEEMQKWYNKDKGQTIVSELLSLLKTVQMA